jgi:hypothetical protein
MTNIRTIFGSALNAVNNTVTSVSGAVSAASSSIDMLNQYIEAASLDQRERQVAHRVATRQKLLRDAKIEIARGNAEVVRFCEESELNKSLFEEADKLVAEAFYQHDR